MGIDHLQRLQTKHLIGGLDRYLIGRRADFRWCRISLMVRVGDGQYKQVLADVYARDGRFADAAASIESGQALGVHEDPEGAASSARALANMRALSNLAPMGTEVSAVAEVRSSATRWDSRVLRLPSTGASSAPYSTRVRRTRLLAGRPPTGSVCGSSRRGGTVQSDSTKRVPTQVSLANTS
jgi:hypothetical protein